MLLMSSEETWPIELMCVAFIYPTSRETRLLWNAKVTMMHHFGFFSRIIYYCTGLHDAQFQCAAWSFRSIWTRQITWTCMDLFSQFTMYNAVNEKAKAAVDLTGVYRAPSMRLWMTYCWLAHRLTRHDNVATNNSSNTRGKSQVIIIIEPCSAPYDRLRQARRSGLHDVKVGNRLSIINR